MHITKTRIVNDFYNASASGRQIKFVSHIFGVLGIISVTTVSEWKCTDLPVNKCLFLKQSQDYVCVCKNKL